MFVVEVNATKDVLIHFLISCIYVFKPMYSTLQYEYISKYVYEANMHISCLNVNLKSFFMSKSGQNWPVIFDLL